MVGLEVVQDPGEIDVIVTFINIRRRDEAGLAPLGERPT